MEKLPEGLLSTTASLPSELDDSMPVDIRDITFLWKAYSVKPSALEGNIGYRLENFFWRLWSNERLCVSLRGSDVARMFMSISESGEVNTPKASSNQDIPVRKTKSEEILPGRCNIHNRRGTPLHSILKKPNSAPRNPPKTTRFIIEEGDSIITAYPLAPVSPATDASPVEHVSPVKDISVTDSSPTTDISSIEHASLATDISSVGHVSPVKDTSPVKDVSPSRHNQKKMHIVAGRAAKNSKRRPVILRRKSSQSNISTQLARTQSYKVMPYVKNVGNHAKQEESEPEHKHGHKHLEFKSEPKHGYEPKLESEPELKPELVEPVPESEHEHELGFEFELEHEHEHEHGHESVPVPMPMPVPVHESKPELDLEPEPESKHGLKLEPEHGPEPELDLEPVPELEHEHDHDQELEKHESEPEHEDEHQFEQDMLRIDWDLPPELPEDCILLPPPVEELTTKQPEPELPAGFLTNFKLLLNLKPRTASWKTAPLTMGFRSVVPNRFRDLRYLYIQYYMPRPASIVDADFRARFVKKMSDEQDFLASLPKDEEDTFGIELLFPAELPPNWKVGMPYSFFHHKPIPLPRFRSLLGMMIEEAKRNGTLTYHTPDPDEIRGPVRLKRCYIDTQVEWNIKWTPE